MDLLIPSFGLIIWTLLAFLIVFFILKKFAWKPILNSLKQRETTIADSLATAERVKAEMAQFKSENEALLAKAREERGQMLKEAGTQKRRSSMKPKKGQKLKPTRSSLDAQAAIEQQKMAALTDVKNQVGQMVIEVSRKVLRRELGNPVTRKTYIRELTNEVKLN